MHLQTYIDSVRHELALAAAAGGEDAQALAERLTAPLESALRLALLDALSDAADHITRDLAPDSVEVRLRGRDPEFAISREPAGPAPAPVVMPHDGDDSGTWRVTLRLPEGLRPAVDAAARSTGASVNSWLSGAVQAALAGGTPPVSTSTQSGKSISGWVR